MHRLGILLLTFLLHWTKFFFYLGLTLLPSALIAQLWQWPSYTLQGIRVYFLKTHPAGSPRCPTRRSFLWHSKGPPAIANCHMVKAAHVNFWSNPLLIEIQSASCRWIHWIVIRSSLTHPRKAMHKCGQDWGRSDHDSIAIVRTAFWSKCVSALVYITMDHLQVPVWKNLGYHGLLGKP